MAKWQKDTQWLPKWVAKAWLSSFQKKRPGWDFKVVRVTNSPGNPEYQIMKRRKK